MWEVVGLPLPSALRQALMDGGFTAAEEAVMEAFVRSHLGDKYGKVDQDSDEYKSARVAAEDLILRTRREAATLASDAAKGELQLSKADLDKERLILQQCAETQADDDEGSEAATRVQEIAAHYQGLRKQVRERLSDAARRRKEKRSARVDAQVSREEQEELEALQSSPAFKAMTREERRMKQDRIKQRAKARARQRKRVVEAEEDAREQSVAAKMVTQLNKAELGKLQAAATSAIEESAGNPEAASKMLAEFDERRKMARAHLSDQHKQQVARMKERLAKARLKKQEALTVTVSDAVDVSSLDVPELEVAPESVMELEAMEKNQQRMETELRKRHEQELKELEERMRKEIDREIAKREAKRHDWMVHHLFTRSFREVLGDTALISFLLYTTLLLTFSSCFLAL